MTVRATDGQPRTREFESSIPAGRSSRRSPPRSPAAIPYPLPTDQAIHGVAVLEAIVESAARDGGAVDLA